MELSVVMLAYHGDESLRRFFPEVKKVIGTMDVDSVEYLIVDSANPAVDTEGVCRELGVRYVKQEEFGYGGAYRTAIRHAQGGSVLILDTDGSQSIDQIPRMYQELKAGADVVLGSYVSGEKTDEPRLPRIMSRMLSFFSRLGIGVNIRDFSGSLRLYHTEDLQRLHLVSEDVNILGELILKLELSKGNAIVTKEVPISYLRRIEDGSKYSLIRFVISFGRMLVYSMVLRFLARGGYCTQKHDPRAQTITDLLFYGIVGAMTAAVNLVVYFLLENVVHYLFANAIAWIISVLFAFITNKTIAFNNWDWDHIALVKEFIGFVTSRLITGALDMLMLWLMVDLAAMGGSLPKFLDAITVIILNYVFGKYVFKEKKERSSEQER